MRTAAAGAAYFVLVFALGFVLGGLRLNLLVPAVGPLAAVALELPVMLAAAWWLCGWILRHAAVPAGVGPRLAMGGLAFALLIAAELAVGLGLMGRSLPGQLAAMAAPEGLLGLAAQLLFAAFPLLRAGRRRPA